RTSSCKIGSSSSRWNTLELNEDSMIVIDRPTAMAEMKKKKGSAGEYQNGCSFEGTIRYSVPSELWCNVESTTPRITSGIRTALMTLIAFVRWNRSRTTGENSKASTVV